MSELTRRDAIRRAALSLTALGTAALLPPPLSRQSISHASFEFEEKHGAQIEGETARQVRTGSPCRPSL